MMRERLNQLTQRIERWSLRERVLVLVAALALLLGLTELLVLDPLRAEQRRQAAQAAQAAQAGAWQTELQVLRAQRDALAQGRGAAPADAALARRVDDLQARSAALARQIAQAGGDTQALQRLKPVLARLLERHERVQLVRLDTAPAASERADRPTPATSTAAHAAAGEERLTRHALQVELEGAYLDLLAYLEALEGELPDIGWGEMKLVAQPDGLSRLSLQLFVWRGGAS